MVLRGSGVELKFRSHETKPDSESSDSEPDSEPREGETERQQKPQLGESTALSLSGLSPDALCSLRYSQGAETRQCWFCFLFLVSCIVGVSCLLYCYCFLSLAVSCLLYCAANLCLLFCCEVKLVNHQALLFLLQRPKLSDEPELSA